MCSFGFDAGGNEVKVTDCGSCGCAESDNSGQHSGDGLWCTDCGNYRV